MTVTTSLARAATTELGVGEGPHFARLLPAQGWWFYVGAALGLGVVSKFLEGWAGAVIAKIMVLVFIVVFIQKRPQGLFAVKGRLVEG